MEFKSVRLVEGEETKGAPEKEAAILANHEAEQAAAGQAAAEAQAAAAEAVEGGGSQDDEGGLPELKEEDVLSYIGKRYNKQINSFDELTAQREEAEALPEDVSAYMKYKKETGRGFEDFLNLKKDYDSMDPESLLKNYLYFVC